MKQPHPSDNLILVIDDDEMVCSMLSEILGQEGFEVIRASHGSEGLSMVTDQHPDLVLLDVMMPGMSGFDCLQAIRNLPGNAFLPVVMLTAADDLDSINRSFQLGATDFVAKPILWASLPHRLRYLLRASNALSQLAKSESELRSAQKIAHLGSWEWTVADDVMLWSDEVFNVMAIDRQAFRGHRTDLFGSIPLSEAGKLNQALDLCLKNKHPFHLELSVVHGDNSEHLINIQGEPVIEHDTVVRVHGTAQDITEHRRIEEQLRFLSYYDPLTGLPNRTLFKEMLGQAMTCCNRFQSVLAVLFISIDRFKRINETLGPSIGDNLLKIFADRLVTEVRDSDYVAIDSADDLAETTVSRLGGNEFTVLLNNIRDSRDSVKVAKRIFQAMADSFNVENNEIFLSINIGIAVYPGDGGDEDSIIKNGQFAMHHARDEGQNTYQFFSKSLNVAAFHKLSMENSLCRAIERNELVLYYQPKIDMHDNRVVGCEALVRWQHPEFGLVPPSQFIPIAEDSGLIAQISNWVLERACTQMRDWQQQDLPPLVVAVNVSANQFRQRRFAAQVHDLLSRLQLAPQHLKLELTESILLQGIDDALITLRKLRALGVHISIDDFGTGYSSLAYLKKLPISELKIDRSFIRDIPNNEDDMAITSAILALAQSLELEVVAEGVEHEDQARFLLEQGCRIAQGFLYSKPIDHDEFALFVRQFGV